MIEPQHLATLQEMADGLMNVKLAIDDIRNSKTLKQVLGTLLAIGNFLNGKEVSLYNIHNTSYTSKYMCMYKQGYVDMHMYSST